MSFISKVTKVKFDLLKHVFDVVSQIRPANTHKKSTQSPQLFLWALMCHLGIVDFYWPVYVRWGKLAKVFIGCQVIAVALSWSGGRSLQWQDKAETLIVCSVEAPSYGNVICFHLSDSLLALVWESSLGKTQGTRVWLNLNPGHKGLTEKYYSLWRPQDLKYTLKTWKDCWIDGKTMKFAHTCGWKSP